MKVCLYAALLILVPLAYSQEKTDIRLAGIAINTTTPEKPLAAPVEIILNHDGCKMTVSPPLVGSGHCLIKSYDEKSKQIEILSEGPPFITWTGNIKGNLASGTYKVDTTNEGGSFYFAILKQAVAAEVPSPPTPVAPIVPRSSCSPAVESYISGDINGWEGETIFKLDNGQIWQQAVYSYIYFYEYHPEVTIYDTTDGCQMKVDGEDETVVVRRIK